MPLEYAVERITEVWDELQPLGQAHYAEVSGWQAPFHMDRVLYQATEAAGQHLFVTARAGGELVGYAGFFIGRHNYADVITATQDCVYLRPAHRQGWNALGLLGFADATLRDRQVQIVLHGVPINHDFSPVLRTLGYRPSEILWERHLHGATP